MTKNDLKSSEEISVVLGLDSESSGRRRLWWLIGAGVVLLLVVAVYFLLRPGEGTALSFETAEVQRGDLTVTVTATGTVQPVNQVDVGSELWSISMIRLNAASYWRGWIPNGFRPR